MAVCATHLFPEMRAVPPVLDDARRLFLVTLKARVVGAGRDRSAHGKKQHR